MYFLHAILLSALFLHQVLSDFTRIDTEFLQIINAEPEGTLFNVIVEMKPFPNSQLDKQLEGVEGTYRSYIIRQVLLEETNATHFTLIQSLLKFNPPPTELQSFWISNRLFFKATRKLILQFAKDNGKLAVENVLLVREELSFIDEPEEPEEEDYGGKHPTDTKWHIKHVGADAWQAANYTGEGVIIGHIDSGVDHKHPELFKAWLGPPYGWHDPVNNVSSPFDKIAHGTATLSLAVGETLGIAPGARWISCINRGPNDTYPKEHFANACGEFLLCPDPDLDPLRNCSRRPRVINCSFGRPPNKRGAFDYMSAVIMKWLGAGIIPVFSAGNSGKDGCETIKSPSDRDDVFSVGSIGLPHGTETVAPSSSRGPAVQRHGNNSQNVTKPDFVAPGWYVTVANAKGGTRKGRGTSYATAVVTGCIALLLSRNSGMRYKGVENLFHRHARKTPPALMENIRVGKCGGREDDVIPNFKFGHGSIRLPSPNSMGKPKPPPPVPQWLSNVPGSTTPMPVTTSTPTTVTPSTPSPGR